MPNITSTISLNSSTLFPNPLNIGASAVNQINGEFDTQSIVLNSGQKITVFGTTIEGDPSNTVYFYLQSVSTNSDDVTVYIQDENDNEIVLALLHPSDFMWLPLAIYGPNVKISCSNLSLDKTSKVNLFWGQRS